MIAFRPRSAAIGGTPEFIRFRELSKPLIGDLGIADKDIEKLYTYLTEGRKAFAVKILHDHYPYNEGSRVQWAMELEQELEKLL